MKDRFDEMTATNLFIKPILQISQEDQVLNGFENAYIKDELRDIEYPNAVYLLFRPMRAGQFNLFVEGERERGAILDEYDYDNGWTMLVYKYDKKWQNDVNLILQGKFSEVSEEYKNQIPKILKSPQGEVISLQHHVFAKDEWMKEWLYERYGIDVPDDVEHWKFYTERETFTEQTLKQLV